MSALRTLYTVLMTPGVVRAPTKRLTPALNPVPFRIQPRDIEIVRFVDRNRFATADQAARHVGGSRRGVANRMRHMFDHGILSRPEQQYLLLRAFHTLGNSDLAYALGREGARLLAQLGDPVNAALDWNSKNDAVVPFTLNHEIEVTETMLEFELACKGSSPNIELIDQDRLSTLLPEETRNALNPFACGLSVRLPHLGKPLLVTTIPDRLFSLQYGDGTRHNFALEKDRGTMPVGTRRTRLVGRSSFRKKQIGYFHLWKQGLHEERWGFKRFRILTITQDGRIKTMLKAQREVTKDTAHGLFLYTTPERIAQHGVLGPAWISAEQDDVSLLQSRKD